MKYFQKAIGNISIHAYLRISLYKYFCVRNACLIELITLLKDTSYASLKPQASSLKPQASSLKPQASSYTYKRIYIKKNQALLKKKKFCKQF